jgi:hypothetical protein
MLEARNSLYRQGYRNRRRSEEGKTYTTAPPEPSSAQQEEARSRDMRRVGFGLDECPAEYRGHVAAYFSALRENARTEEDSLDARE